MSGDDVTFTEDDVITCIFADERVDGVYVNEEQVLCVSPELPQTGIVPFRLKIVHNGTLSFRGIASYNSCKFQKHTFAYIVSVSCSDSFCFLQSKQF